MNQTNSGIFVQSGYGVFERKPYVEIQMRQDGEVRNMQVAPDEAREVAHNLLECAEAAEVDAFLLEWGQEAGNLSLEAAAGLVQEFRKWREARDRNKDGNTQI